LNLSIPTNGIAVDAAKVFAFDSDQSHIRSGIFWPI